MVYDQPAPVAIPIHKAEPCGTGNRFTVAILGKRVGPGVDCNVSVYSNSLLTQDNLVRRWNALKNLEVVTNGRGGVTERGRPRAPQDHLRVVEGNNSFRIVAIHAINPCLRGRAYILLGPRQCERWAYENQEQREHDQGPLHDRPSSADDCEFAELLAGQRPR